MQNNKETIEKLKKILKVSNSIKIEQLRVMLNLDEKVFNEKLIDWAEEFGFTIDREYININKAQLDLLENREIVYFRGAQIPQIEADMLQEIEKQLNKEFTKVGKVIWSTRMGFTAENNRITGIGLYQCGVSTLPESIGNLSSLKELILIENNLTTLPESIGSLTSLQTLGLRDNQLTTLPESIGNLSSLIELNLYENKLKTLPESIVNLSSLKELELRSNNITTLPESIGDLKSLEKLFLRDNQLTTLPESIGILSSLQILDLRVNQLSSLPESIKILEKRGVDIHK